MDLTWKGGFWKGVAVTVLVMGCLMLGLGYVAFLIGLKLGHIQECQHFQDMYEGVQC